MLYAFDIKCFLQKYSFIQVLEHLSQTSPPVDSDITPPPCNGHPPTPHIINILIWERCPGEYVWGEYHRSGDRRCPRRDVFKPLILSYVTIFFLF